MFSCNGCTSSTDNQADDAQSIQSIHLADESDSVTNVSQSMAALKTTGSAPFEWNADSHSFTHDADSILKASLRSTLPNRNGSQLGGKSSGKEEAKDEKPKCLHCVCKQRLDEELIQKRREAAAARRESERVMNAQANAKNQHTMASSTQISEFAKTLAKEEVKKNSDYVKKAAREARDFAKTFKKCLTDSRHWILGKALKDGKAILKLIDQKARCLYFLRDTSIRPYLKFEVSKPLIQHVLETYCRMDEDDVEGIFRINEIDFDHDYPIDLKEHKRRVDFVNGKYGENALFQWRLVLENAWEYHLKPIIMEDMELIKKAYKECLKFYRAENLANSKVYYLYTNQEDPLNFFNEQCRAFQENMLFFDSVLLPRVENLVQGANNLYSLRDQLFSAIIFFLQYTGIFRNGYDLRHNREKLKIDDLYRVVTICTDRCNDMNQHNKLFMDEYRSLEATSIISAFTKVRNALHFCDMSSMRSGPLHKVAVLSSNGLWPTALRENLDTFDTLFSNPNDTSAYNLDKWDQFDLVFKYKALITDADRPKIAPDRVIKNLDKAILKLAE